jgi:two-component system, OmpR family, response regulator RegX3
MNPTPRIRVNYRFDNIVVDGDRQRIEKNGEPCKLTPRALEVLIYLVEHNDQIIEKQELFDEVWKEKVCN